jgi:hypothetical protein
MQTDSMMSSFSSLLMMMSYDLVRLQEEEVLVVQVRSRAMAPQRPRGLKEGKGGNGGAHRK